MTASTTPPALDDSTAEILLRRAGPKRRYRISPEAGKALEKLGHAIDYLMDEFLNAGGSFCGNEPQLEAIRVLMAINRQIYLGCPEAPTLRERDGAWLRLRTV